MHKKIVQRDTDDNESLSSSTEEIKERKKKKKKAKKSAQAWMDCVPPPLCKSWFIKNYWTFEENLAKGWTAINDDFISFQRYRGRRISQYKVYNN